MFGVATHARETPREFFVMRPNILWLLYMVSMSLWQGRPLKSSHILAVVLARDLSIVTDWILQDVVYYAAMHAILQCSRLLPIMLSTTELLSLILLTGDGSLSLSVESISTVFGT